MNKEYDARAIDMWSLGVTLFEILGARIPWQNTQSSFEISQSIMAMNIKWPKHRVDKAGKNIITKMMQPKEEKRATVSDALDSAFVSELDLVALVNLQIPSPLPKLQDDDLSKLGDYPGSAEGVPEHDLPAKDEFGFVPSGKEKFPVCLPYM